MQWGKSGASSREKKKQNSAPLHRSSIPLTPFKNRTKKKGGGGGGGERRKKKDSLFLLIF